ncbi:MAG: hypothetical protein N4A32_06830 [Marinifilaceae bacterium]|jgi:hypothetical protein|nr:hypothetical protein [Marinifilaceae bacterium]
MNSTLIEIIKSREDISDYLFHFTKGCNAKKTLMEILQTNCIKDINNNGYICFTETPITLLTKMFELFSKYENPLYAPYGIGIKKDYLYSIGARNVIYGSNYEKEYLSEEINWRFEEYDPEKKDFTWLREWRINKNKINLEPQSCFIIIKKNEEFKDIILGSGNFDIEIDGDRDFTFGYCNWTKTYKWISFEELSDFNKNKMNKLIKEQKLEEIQSIYLGSF